MPQPGWSQPGSQPSFNPPQDRRVRLPISLAVTGVGLALVIAGSFLPWLTSGEVVRNSYQISAIAYRLGVLGDGFATALLAAWPMLGPVCFLPVIAALLRWWRTAGAAAVIIGLLAALLGAVVLVEASGKSAAGIAVEPTGPVTMLIGGVLLLGAGSVLLTVRRRRSRVGTVGAEELRGAPAVDGPGS